MEQDGTTSWAPKSIDWKMALHHSHLDSWNSKEQYTHENKLLDLHLQQNGMQILLHGLACDTSYHVPQSIQNSSLWSQSCFTQERTNAWQWNMLNLCNCVQTSCSPHHSVFCGKRKSTIAVRSMQSIFSWRTPSKWNIERSRLSASQYVKPQHRIYQWYPMVYLPTCIPWNLPRSWKSG